MEERNDLMVTENTEVAENYDYDEVTESTGNGGGTVGIILGVGAALVGGGIAAWKNRDKLKEWHQERQITKAEKKLKKYGCKVVRTSEEEVEAIEEFLEEVETIEE